MTAASIIAGVPPTNTFTRSRSPAANGGRVMQSDRAVNLVVQADFLVLQVISSRQLDAVHPQVRAGKAGAIGVFGVDFRQRDKRPAVAGPARHLRQMVDRRRVLENGPRTDQLRPHSPKRRRNLAIPPRLFQGYGRIDLEFDESADTFPKCRGTEIASARCVPKRLLTIGNRQPRTRA